MDIGHVLRNAALLHKRVSFEYDHKTRIVEVHALGMSKTGKYVLRGYQVDGGSVSGNPSPWRLYSVARIPGLPKILDEDSLAPRIDEGYAQGDKGMSSIEFEL